LGPVAGISSDEIGLILLFVFEAGRGEGVGVRIEVGLTITVGVGVGLLDVCSEAGKNLPNLSRRKPPILALERMTMTIKTIPKNKRINLFDDISGL
jgi:hypothetical protein